MYFISTKYTPSGANPFLSLTVTYVTAAVLSFLIFLTSGKGMQLPAEVSKLNWTALILGISIVGLELGYIYIYRVGWKMGIGSLVANIALACILLLIGALFLKESISIRQLIGVFVCMAGLILVTK